MWHAQLEYSKKVQQKLQTARLVRQRRQKLACLAALWQHRAYKGDCRKQNLQANFYRSFVLLTTAVAQWKAAANTSVAKRIRVNRALSFWASRQYSKALAAWQLSVHTQQESAHMKEQARSLYRCNCCSAVLQHWQQAVEGAQSARQTAVQALQVTQFFP